jgi:hypothetical protein
MNTVKKNSVSIKAAIILLLWGLVLLSSAASLRVGRDYAEISDAIDAAVSGDTIMIPGNRGEAGFWSGNFAIDKPLVLMADSLAERFEVYGDVDITTPGSVQILGISLVGGDLLYSPGVLGDENELILANSILFGNFATGAGAGKVKILGTETSKVFNAGADFSVDVVSSVAESIYLYSGRVIGSRLSFLDIRGASVDSAARIQVIANRVDSISINTSTRNFDLYNNEIKYGVEILELRSANGSNNRIINNSFNGSFVLLNRTGCASDEQVILPVSSDSGKVLIFNNNISGMYSGDALFCNSFRVVVSAYNYSGAGASSILYAEGGPRAEGIENAGHPDSRYMDLDLTRNDVGINGGPHAWSNYWPEADEEQKARVFSVKVPHKIVRGQSFTIEAEAFDH